jgi:hypothetical protein
VISGNPWYGILVRTPIWDGALPPSNGTTDRTVIADDYVRVSASGSTELANGGKGVMIDSRVTNTRIGPDGNGVRDSEERNIISGNAGDGVYLADPGTPSGM